MNPAPAQDIDSPITIGEYLGVLAPRIWAGPVRAAPTWPPDLFAIAASLLHRSGGYRCIVHAWRATQHTDLATWVEAIDAAAFEWCDHLFDTGPARAAGTALPALVRDSWATLVAGASVPLFSLPSDANLCRALIHLLTVADHAYGWLTERLGTDESDAAGPPPTSFPAEGPAERALRLLSPYWTPDRGSTLCDEVHFSRVRVLPKVRTPKTGINIRSLSHHLALCPATEVRPRWHSSFTSLPAKGTLNFLLIPWPDEVHARQFTEKTIPAHHCHDLPPDFGYFGFEHPPGRGPETVVERVRDLIDSAEKSVGPVHAVILPELSLSEPECAALRNTPTQSGLPPLLIAGVVGSNGAWGTNRVAVSYPFFGGPSTAPVFQNKHHRWLLDSSQLVTYGLGSALDPNRSWWEAIEIADRELNFFEFYDWLTMCVLICEDLARSDPVGDIVRAVGPNLVIALLMDGPQLKGRWSSKYATVLGDDPGCSTLSLTSIGMAVRSRPVGQPPSRCVALWKDPTGPPVEIDLPQGYDGIVLSLAQHGVREYTADGRLDEETASTPVFSGLNYVRRNG